MMRFAIPAVFLGTGTAMAHSGHEAAVVQGEAHWLTQGDHLAVVVLALLAAGFTVRHALRRRTRQKA